MTDADLYLNGILLLEKRLFSDLVIVYIFLGGASAGSFFIMSAWSLRFHRSDKRPTFRFSVAFKSLMAWDYSISLILLLFALFCLFWDLYYPDKALLLITCPHFTLITFGTYALICELLIGLALVVANVLNPFWMKGRLRRGLEIACCISSALVMAYTGLYLSTNLSVAFWSTWVWIMPLLFLFSSLSSGISITLLIDYFIKDQTLLLRAAKPLQKVHLTCLALVTVLIAIFMYSVLGNPNAAKSVTLLMQPGMFSTAVVGVVGMGIVIPACLETYTLRLKECRTIPVSDVICLIGGFLLRYCIILCGVH